MTFCLNSEFSRFLLHVAQISQTNVSGSSDGALLEKQLQHNHQPLGSRKVNTMQIVELLPFQNSLLQKNAFCNPTPTPPTPHPTCSPRPSNFLQTWQLESRIGHDDFIMKMWRIACQYFGCISLLFVSTAAALSLLRSSDWRLGANRNNASLPFHQIMIDRLRLANQQRADEPLLTFDLGQHRIVCFLSSENKLRGLIEHFAKKLDRRLCEEPRASRFWNGARNG